MGWSANRVIHARCPRGLTWALGSGVRHMRQTTVEFQLRTPLDAASQDSLALDQLLGEWRGLVGVIATHVEWRSRPAINALASRVGHVEVAVTIESETARGLRKLYDGLARNIEGTLLQLSGRSCTLTDMYD